MKKEFKLFSSLPTLAALLLLVFSSCNTTKQSSGSSKQKKIIDTVYVKYYDTSRQVIEMLDFTTKTVELFDTVFNRKDSLLVILKKRTTYENGSKSSVLNQNGLGYDSQAANIEYREVIKWKEKEAERTPTVLFIFIGLGIIAAVLIYFIIKK
jgi:hypothetical protein